MPVLDGDKRVKLRHFIIKWRRPVLIIIIVLAVLIIIDRVLMRASKNPTKETTYTPNVPLLDSNAGEIPKKVSNEFENFIDKYVNYCNNRNYVEAYNMISDDCKENFFGNSFNSFKSYVQQKFTTTKRYAIQDYSNLEDAYIYNVKIFDDYLATGLTGQTYRYQEEKFMITYDKDDNLVINVGNYMGSRPLNYMASNEYILAEVTNVIEKYSFASYTLKITNRTNYIIVVKDGLADATEVGLAVGEELRGTNDNDIKIILDPGESKTVNLAFPEFYDSGLEPKGIVLDAVRVMENYTGSLETADEEIENAVDKFSMTIAF